MTRRTAILLGAGLALLGVGGLTLYRLAAPEPPPEEPGEPAASPRAPGSATGSALPPSSPRTAEPEPRSPERPEPRPPPTGALASPPRPAPPVPAVQSRAEVERERRDRVAYFKTQLAGLREKVVRLERQLGALESAGHGDREPARQFRLELDSARRAEPRMKRHLEQAEWEVRYGPLPPASGSR